MAVNMQAHYNVAMPQGCCCSVLNWGSASNSSSNCMSQATFMLVSFPCSFKVQEQKPLVDNT